MNSTLEYLKNKQLIWHATQVKATTKLDSSDFVELDEQLGRTAQTRAGGYSKLGGHWRIASAAALSQTKARSRLAGIYRAADTTEQ